MTDKSSDLLFMKTHLIILKDLGAFSECFYLFLIRMT